MKRKRGRKKGSGVKSSIDARRDSLPDIHEKLYHGHRDWRMVRLRELIGDGSKLPDNSLRARQAERNAKVTEICYELRNKVDAIRRENLTEKEQAVLKRLRSRNIVRKLTNREKDALRKEAGARRAELKAKADAAKRVWAASQCDEIDALWNTLSAQFERAVLDGDAECAEWLERQARAIRTKDNRTDQQKARDRFDAAVIHELGMAFGRTQSKQRAEQEKNEERWKQARQFEREQYLNSPEGRAANQQQRQAKMAALTLNQTAKPHIESATLEPAGKYANVTAGQIYDSLQKEEYPTESRDGKPRQPHGVKVEGCYFENRERCCEAIRELAKLLELQLPGERGKHPKTKPSKPLSTDYYHGLSRKARRTAIEKLRRIVSTD